MRSKLKWGDFVIIGVVLALSAAIAAVLALGTSGDRLYAVWDYTPGWQFTDQLIVGNTDNEGKVKYVSWEC